MLKLPSAWISGVRLKLLEKNKCVTTVKFKWINQNPFGSMYFAVQAMAAELSTGALVLSEIKTRKYKTAMLVAQNKAVFSKKAVGRIYFTCLDGHLVAPAIDEAFKTGEGQTFWMKSTGMNEKDEIVAVFDFQWTVKVKMDVGEKASNGKITT